MKIFSIYAPIVLFNEPLWLVEYRKKYDQLYEFHVTLKQPCFIKEDELPSLQNRLSVLLKRQKIPGHKLKSSFKEIAADGSNPIDGCIMIRTEDNQIRQQKSIITELLEYSDYYTPESEQWEKYFKPHLTIAQGLNSQRYQKALKDLPAEVSCEGVMDEVILSIVDPLEAEEKHATRDIKRFKL